MKIYSESLPKINLGTMLRSQNDIFPVFTLFSCGAVVCMIFAVLGIKLKWFKHRLDFGNLSQVERSDNSSQRGEPILLQGIFHPRQDADAFIQDERPAPLPPVRIRSPSKPSASLNENVNESKNPAVERPGAANVAESWMKDNASNSEIKLSKTKANSDIKLSKKGQNKAPTVKEINEVPRRNHHPKKAPVPLKREKKVKEAKHGQPSSTAKENNTESNSQKSENNSKSARHFEKLKDEHSPKSRTQNAISERRPTGFVRPSPDEMENIISPNHLSLNLHPSNSTEPARDNMMQLNFNKINSSDEESQNIFEKVRAKPKPEPRKIILTTPENEKPPETDAWSAVTRHRMLTQEIAKQHKLKPVNRNQSNTSSENLQFQSSIVVKPKTMRDMKKSKGIQFEIGGHDEDADA